MGTLVVYAHPQTEGHCPFILEEVKKFLTNHGVKHEVIDLYKIKYDPVLHEDEHYTVKGHWNISKQNKEFQEKVGDADHLIFIYPVWWNTMPAILKGWFDRVFTARFAFKYVNGIPRGLLRGKKAIIFCTTGAPWYGALLFLRNQFAWLIRFDLLAFCGVYRTKVCHIGNCTKWDDSRKLLIERKVNRTLGKFF